MSSSVHVDNKKEDISILGEGPTQGLNGTTLTAEKRYSVNFTLTKKICVSVHFNGENLIYLLMIQKLLNLRRKILKLQQFHYLQEMFQQNFFVDNIKQSGIKAYVYDFSDDCDTFAVNDILGIHKYLMKKNGIV